MELLIREDSRIKLYALDIAEREDGSFRVMRRGGRSLMATKKPGIDAIRLLDQGLRINEVRRTIAERYRCAPKAINTGPLLKALEKARLIRRVDGRTACRGEVTPWSFIEFYLRCRLRPRLLRWSARHLPLGFHRRVLFWAAFLGLRRAMRPKCRDATKNATAVMGSGLGAARRFERTYFRHLVKNVVDVESLLSRTSREVESWLKRTTRCHGLEHLDAALRQKRGVIVSAFHFSTNRLIPLLLTRQGYSVASIGPLNLGQGRPTLEKIARLREENSGYGELIVSNDLDVAGVGRLIQRLRRNEIVLCYPDAYAASVHEDAEMRERARFFNFARPHFPRSAVGVPFFNHVVQTNEWLGWLFDLSGAVVLPAVLLRGDDDSLDLHLDPPLSEGLPSDRRQARNAMNGAVFRVVERYAATHAEQWYGWQNLHKLGFERAPPGQESAGS